MVMTYQNIWALKTHKNDQDGRAVIGESVFLPLLPSYPENKAFISQANRDMFQLIYLLLWFYTNGSQFDKKMFINYNSNNFYSPGVLKL
jgi:hypothetical protein